MRTQNYFQSDFYAMHSGSGSRSPFLDETYIWISIFALNVIETYRYMYYIHPSIQPSIVYGIILCLIMITVYSPYVRNKLEFLKPTLLLCFSFIYFISNNADATHRFAFFYVFHFYTQYKNNACISKYLREKIILLYLRTLYTDCTKFSQF